MDIFIGSNRTLDEDLIKKSSKIISALGADFTKSDQERISIWKNSLYKNVVEYYRDENYQIVFDGYLNNTALPLQDFLPILGERIIGGKPILIGNETGVFNVAIIDMKTNNIYLASDPSALFPLYYIQTGDLFFFFSHLYIFAETLDLKPDLIGIIEKINFNYTIGSRTLYDSLKRLNPGEVVVFDQGSRKINIRQSEVYFTKYEEYGKDLIDVTWNALNLPFKAMQSNSNKLGVMLSEGFDSRLMAGIADQNGFSVSAFTHGSPGTLGSNITFNVAQKIGAEYHFNPLSEGLPSGDEKLHSQLFLSDNLSIPYWITGNEYFSKTDVACVTSGYALDTTLGGHSYYRPSKPKFLAISQRYLEIINQGVNSLRENYVEELSIDIIDKFRNSFSGENLNNLIDYYFSHDISTKFFGLYDSIYDDLSTEIHRIINTGSQLPSEQLQRFFLEHRGRKFSYGQELTLRQKNKVFTPSYEPSVMRVLSGIHPKHRIQHKLYLEILTRKLQSLSMIPNGGYGIGANKSRIFLETSRFIHKVEESKIIRQYLFQKGKRDISKLRTANFIESTFRKGNALDYFQHFFYENNRIFNQDNLTKKIIRIRNYESKSYQIMDYYRLFEILAPLSNL